jgi:hypothetical protein
VGIPQHWRSDFYQLIANIMSNLRYRQGYVDQLKKIVKDTTSANHWAAKGANFILISIEQIRASMAPKHR